MTLNNVIIKYQAYFQKKYSIIDTMISIKPMGHCNTHPSYGTTGIITVCSVPRGVIFGEARIASFPFFCGACVIGLIGTNAYIQNSEMFKLAIDIAKCSKYTELFFTDNIPNITYGGEKYSLILKHAQLVSEFNNLRTERMVRIYKIDLTGIDYFINELTDEPQSIIQTETKVTL